MTFAAEPPETELTPEGCRIEKFTIPSASMGRDIRVLIVLPPAYMESETQRFPILYTLHGMTAPYDTWSHMTPLRKALATMPMIYTCFDGDPAGWYIDSPLKADSQFNTFFFDEFIPWVDAHYRTNGQRAVTGFSMGGYGAMHYMVEKPELFTSVSSLSGAFSSFQEPLANKRIREAIELLLGTQEDNMPNYAAIDIYHTMRNDYDAGEKFPALMIRCGTDDHLLDDNRKLIAFISDLNRETREKFAKEVEGIEDRKEQYKALKALLVGKTIDYTYVESGGEHDWPYWVGQSQAIAEFHWKHFSESKDNK